MRWLITLLLAMVMFTGTGCLFTDGDGTPDTVVVKDNNPPATNTTVIEHTDPAPAPDVNVDVHK